MDDPAEQFRNIATDTQKRHLDAVKLHGDRQAASVAMGLNKGAISESLIALAKKAAREGHAKPHWDYGVPPGYTVGKVTLSVNHTTGEVERSWPRMSPLTNDIEGLKEAIAQACSDSITPLKKTEKPLFYDEDLLTVIPLGDPHFGLMAWAKEVGTDFDLKIAEEVTFEAIDRLCSRTPPSKTAMLLNLGDFFHADNNTNRTPKGGNNLDVDGRFQQIAKVGFRAMVRCIRRMLEHHQNIIVRNNPGNHDPNQSFMLSMAMDAMFNEEPRVTIDMSPAAFYYYVYGNTLIGSVHGDGPKLADLPLIMAADVPADWAATMWRVWHCGHVHHDQIKDYVGCTVETHRTLAASDAWHRYQGYRSVRGCKAIIYHRETGEEFRIPMKVKM